MTLQLSAVGLAYVHPEGATLFEGIDLQLGRGLYGLVGENGAGKSTLLRILAGLAEPSAGVVTRQGLVGGLAPRERAEGELLPFLARLGLPLEKAEADAGTLSGGEQMKLHLARAFAERPDFLLFDEPTNHLDEAAREALRGLLRAHRGGALIASHDRDFLEEMDGIFALANGTLTFYGGGWSFYKERVAEARGAAERELADAVRAQKGAKRRAHEALERQERRSSKAETRQKVNPDMSRVARGLLKRRAEGTAGRLKGTHDDRVAKAEARRAEARAALMERGTIAVDLSSTRVPARKRIASLEGVNVEFDGWLWPEDLSLELVGPERLAITGNNGSGKSTIVRLLTGELKPDRGKRAALACLLAADQAPELLIVDEPTNDLDVASVESLEQALHAYEGALVVVSHDRAFREEVGCEEELALD